MSLPHLFIDIEALAQTPDAAPIELGAVLFNPETAEILAEFYRIIRPNPWLRKEPATLQWHAERESFPFTDEREARSMPLINALLEFKAWVQTLPEWGSVFSWGSTYDFPILATASALEQVAMPWHYAQQECARTVWRRAFGDRKHAPRPHHALADCRSGVADLCEALIEGHAWEISPAMAQAKIDELNKEVVTLKRQATAQGSPASFDEVWLRLRPFMPGDFETQQAIIVMNHFGWIDNGPCTCGLAVYGDPCVHHDRQNAEAQQPRP